MTANHSPALLPVLLLALSAPFAVSAADPESTRDPLDGTQWAQLTIHERLIIRIPRVSRSQPASATATRAAAPVIWEERKAPRCIAMTKLTGASIDREGEVDLIVEGTKRLRAKLNDECPTLDFYNGFYLKPTGDGKICARRDAIRSRSGGRCAITGFRTLVARR